MVVVIIGIVLTFSVLSLGGDRRGEELGREARQFTELLRLAAEQTVMRGEEWGVQISTDSYRFLVYTDKGWAVQEDDDLFRTRTLTEGTQLDVELEGREVVLGANLDTDSEDAADKNDADKLKPTLFILSSGEISPFVARFAAKETEQRFEVKADARGDLTVETPEH
ncbi:MAG: type II secretion system minor pseudopilin GspH [Gammaproteobacteria bacterium]|nr:type II secretion system minor pseudopilin GspH [Gammaproteobacteria bacterium]